LWDAATGRLVRTLAGHSVALSPDGQFLACGGPGEVLALREAATGRAVWKGPHLQGGGRAVAFSPDGRLVGAGGGGAARGREAGPVLAVAFSPDGRHLATAGADGSVRLWEAGNGVEQAVLRGHTGRVGCVAFHPCGRYLVSGGQQPGDVKIWDLTRPQEYLTAARPGPGADQEVEALAFAGDARLVLLRRAGVGRPHDASIGVPTGERRLPSPLPLLPTAALAAFSPGGRRLAAAVPGRPGEVAVWDAAEGKRLHTLRGRALRVVSLAWSGD